ncbi:MAG: acetate--CoA ligase family protein [Candidatus Buchananbacteria bacterium]
MKLQNFLFPKTIAVIGASANPAKLGYQILNNILAGGFTGQVYPINLQAQTILGLATVANIKQLKPPVDLAIIAIPAALVLAEVENCAIAGIKNLVIITAGFGELNLAGKKLEQQLEGLVKKYQLNILGPNCLGFVNSGLKLNATFAKTDLKSGRVAFLSQSGAIGSAVLDLAAKQNFGFSYFLSLGNKADLTENDCLEFLANDPQTDLIVIYLESIAAGQRMLSLLTKISAKKPVAILKAGITKAGAQAALSHTGSLASSAVAVQAAWARAGVIELKNIGEMFNLLEVYQTKLLKGNDELFILSNAGGPLVVTVDALSELNLSLGQYTPALTKKLSQVLPPTVQVKNPLDILGDAEPARYQLAIDGLLAEPKVHNLLILLTPQTATLVKETALVITQAVKKYPQKNIFVSFIGGQAIMPALEILQTVDLINFINPAELVGLLAKIFNYKNSRQLIKPYLLSTKPASAVIKNEQLDFLAAQKLLTQAGIQFVNTKVIKRLADLETLKYPIVLKVVGPKIIHKTELQAVLTNLTGLTTAQKAYLKLSKIAQKFSAQVIAQAMVKEAQEIMIGFKQDPNFGPLVIVGQGGIYAEVFKDVQVAIADLDQFAALALLKQLKIYPILAGSRGLLPVNLKALAQVIVKIARLAQQNPQWQELDLNPVFVGKQKVLAVDVRIII